jgi:hypothetical protein
MKRTMYVAGISMLVLALVFSACMLFNQDSPPDPEPEYDAQGRRLVTLTIDTGDKEAARNMDLTIAQVAVNYYEVVFSDGATVPTYYRASGPKGKILTIRLPVDHQLTSDATNAIAFAGFWDRATNDKTLLATGTIVAVRERNASGGWDLLGPNELIKETTIAIQFTLSAIETRFGSRTNNAAATATNERTSFQIKAPAAAADPFFPEGNYVSGSGRNTTIAHLVTLENNGLTRERPFWRLPSNRESGTQLGDSVNPEAAFTYKVQTGHDAGIIVVLDNPDFEFDSWAILTGNADDGITAVQARPKSIGGAPINWAGWAAGGVYEDDGYVAMPLGEILIDIALFPEPVHQGFCLLVINLPVYAMAANIHNGDLWTLRNGMYDYEIQDNAITVDNNDGYNDYGVSLGGALMLCIGDVQSVNGMAIKILFAKVQRP